jgi:predicted metal-binding membrane protein
MEWTMSIDPKRAGIVLAAAGVYELTPLKTACLRHCQSPATFLLQRFTRSAFVIGIEHAVWCLGCCVGLMAVLVFAAAMDLRWAAALAAVVFVQKALPTGSRSALAVGVLLIVAAVIVSV